MKTSAIVALALVVFASSVRADDERPEVQKMRFVERGDNLEVTAKISKLFDNAAYEALDSGFTSTVLIRIWIYPRDSTDPIAATAFTRQVLYNLWDEVYELRFEEPGGKRVSKEKRKSEAFKRLTDLNDFPVAKLADLPDGQVYLLAMELELNPVSKETLAEVRRWLSQGTGGGLDCGGAFFGSFVSVFVNPKIAEADRVLRRAAALLPAKTMTKRIKRLPLQLKLTVALVLIVMLPLAFAAFLVGETGRTAANVAASDASKRISAMEKAAHRYHDSVDTTKRLHAEVTKRLAARPDLAALAPSANLQKVLTDEGLHAIALLRPDGSVIAEAEAALPGPTWRGLVTDEPIGTTGATLRVTFAVQDTIREDLKEIKDAIDGTRAVSQIQTALPNSYQTGFLVVLGIAGLVAASAGIWASTLVTRRITSLVAAARSVSDGHLETRVELRGADEMAELGSAFNTMLDDLDETRRQIEYLQRMGVWQDVARRLAHEIKNPLTPIQLAVQQCVSAYKGEDARFKKLLTDTGEIVEEEIEGLRRLVDTFRTLGALPKVEAAPIPLGEAIEELKLDPTMALRLTLKPPAAPVTVRADKLLLKRVLANLVENGIHAGQEAGNAGDVTVAWTSDARGELVAITVDDHGKGVTEANREKIFEPYVTTKSTGTGLGLAIARKIAIEHGGELAVAADRAPTGGARFVVSLPLRGPESSLA